MACCVVPKGAPGLWSVVEISLEEVIQDLEEGEFISTIGHPSSAHILETLTGFPFEACRREADPRPGDEFYCFILNSRAPEGKILDEHEIYKIGFSFRKMTYVLGKIPTAPD
ncbi:putative DNA binding protein [Synechococcus phage S-CBWM1]|uniref:Putative DNA binding protein n=1 Tax=Synechococcus phage S-CBWM1 TaxID=2053653 RepID=A0A3G1L3G2_9CAUD|nr:putative DNA binding protein [Synechococcus phage S-CBWM1]ATW62719.1 putative DNA binding protein [Synechococcus phage S-CBWM1]